MIIVTQVQREEVSLPIDEVERGQATAAYRSEGRVEISARNQIAAKVTRVTLGDVMAEVVVEIEPATLAAAITRGSAEHLGLKAGDAVTVIVKATEVMIGKDR
jgi:molybdopterin-binding protein